MSDFLEGRRSDFRFELSVVQDLCEVVNSPYSLAFSLLINCGQYADAFSLPFNPLNYNDIASFEGDYLISSVWKKNSTVDLGIDVKEEALLAFDKAENICARTNKKLDSSDFVPFLYETKKNLQSILSTLTGDDLNFVEANLRFGTGANAFRVATGSVLSDKYDCEVTLTDKLIPFLRALMGTTWWDHVRPLVVKGNEFATVPKTCKTDRGICKEPLLNSFLQLAIGRLLRARLLKAGIDLRDQSRNQDFAQRAYFHRFATIDLSMASDTVARELVRTLLDRDWCHLLDICRCDLTLMPDGTWVRPEKYSSNGNGYTFELESLVFLSIARSVVPRSRWSDICVYGDDLIVPEAYAETMVEALNSLGFSVNSEKSYLAGNFFESCGADFFKGHPVRPFYLRKQKEKGPNDSPLPYSMQIANALRHYSSRINFNINCDSRFKNLWLKLFKMSNKTYRACKVPPSYGDVGFVVSFDESNGKPLRHGHQGVLVQSLQMTPATVVKRTVGRFITALYYAGPSLNTNEYIWQRSTSNLYQVREYTKSYALKLAASGPQAITPLFSAGREVRRGIFGVLKTRSTVVFDWDVGYCWGERIGFSQ